MTTGSENQINKLKSMKLISLVIFFITGCLVCSNGGSTGVFKEQGVQVSTEWSTFQIQGSNNENRDIVLCSLRNKIKIHFCSKAHALAEKIETLKKKKSGRSEHVITKRDLLCIQKRILPCQK